MYSRQKSFFDQDQKKKPRYPQWKRKPDQLPAAREPVPRPPIAPSSQTRAKLKAFEFHDEHSSKDMATGAGDENKENEVVAVHQDEVDSDDTINGEDETTPTRRGPSSHKDISNAPPPCTPATRLPLADLVGNVDRAPSAPAASPEEQLCWQNTPDSQIPTSSAVRGKKRARSSSPVTSSQSTNNASATKNKSFEAQSTNLKTPQADPAADLWNRYAMATQSREGSSKKNVSFAHLINESSSKSSATAGTVSGLRRWTSCGLEWPTSNAKRRKRTGTFRGQVDPEATKEAPTPATSMQTGESKAERLLDQIQKTLAKQTPAKPQEAPSSSSPMPNIRAFHDAHQASPLQNFTKPRQRFASRKVPAQTTPSKAAQQRNVGRKSASPPEFDFEDMDDDLMETLEATQAPKNTALQGATSNLIEKTRADSKNVASEPTNGEATVQGDTFEFDDDDDLFDDDLTLSPKKSDPPAGTGAVETSRAPAKDSPSKISAPVVAQAGSDDDDFGGFDMDEEHFFQAEAFATQAVKATGSTQSSNKALSHVIDPCLITEVRETIYNNERGQPIPQKVLRIQNERQKFAFLVYLRQSWYNSLCQPGAYVNIIGNSEDNGSCIIDDNRGLLILHPDQLLSATTVSESSECLRRSVLNDRIKAATNKNNALVYGHILHALFQQAIKSDQWDDQFLGKCLKQILPQFYEDLLEINLSMEEATEHVKSKMPIFRAWAKVYIRTNPDVNAMVEARNGEKVQLSISKLLDVEENIMSPMYGLKGKIDATVQVAEKDSTGQKTLTVPFELKTGKNSVSHRAQTALYTLLLSDRYNVNVGYGILWNIETTKMSKIPAVRHLVRPLIQRRNELACWVRERSVIPPMLQSYRFCDTCKVRDACFTYNRFVEGGDGGNLQPKAKEKFDELVKHLKPSHRDFFIKWQALLSHEESDMMKFRKELWSMLSIERERLGRAFSNVVIEPGSFSEIREGSTMNRCRYTFTKHKKSSSFSFAESQLVTGEPIVVSDENGHFALAKGFVTGVHKRRITVTVDRALHNARRKKPRFDPDTNQVFAGITELLDPASGTFNGCDDEPIIYRIDKDEFASGMGIPRNNIIQIMNDSVYKASELRSIIVDGRAPIFNPRPSKSIQSTQPDGLPMNPDQQNAIEKVNAAKDYALILGMPGTGKTTTIAQIIRDLVSRGKSIFLTSFQHSAVDNILLKIKDDNIPILRLGSVSKVHPQVRDFAILAETPKSNIDEIEKSWYQPPIVASTCLQVSHPIFQKRIFDYCIVDEASQITLPVCLGPIRMASKFVLVGDHHQLPPLVKNKQALEGGLDASLFRLLCDQQPTATVNLEHQYRMAGDVMMLANELIYGGRLKCGTRAIEQRTLDIPKPDVLERCHYPAACAVSGPLFSNNLGSICRTPLEPSTCHLARILQPETRVLFLDTDNLAETSREVSSGHTAVRIINPFEAALLNQITSLLLSAGVPADELGIITPFRSQLALLKSHLQTNSPTTSPNSSQIELNTADKYQGRDKDCILVSFVRNNSENNVGELLRDERRVNVAITRAKSKLILVGSKKTLMGGSELLRKMISLCDSKGWTHPLGKGCVDGHVTDESEMTQRSGVLVSPEIARAKAIIGGGKKATQPTKASESSRAPPAPASQSSITDDPELAAIRSSVERLSPYKTAPLAQPRPTLKSKDEPKQIIDLTTENDIDLAPKSSWDDFFSQLSQSPTKKKMPSPEKKNKTASSSLKSRLLQPSPIKKRASASPKKKASSPKKLPQERTQPRKALGTLQPTSFNSHMNTHVSSSNPGNPSFSLQKSSSQGGQSQKGKGGSSQGQKKPGKVIQGKGQRSLEGFFKGRPVLEDVFRDAL